MIDLLKKGLFKGVLRSFGEDILITKRKIFIDQFYNAYTN